MERIRRRRHSRRRARTAALTAVASIALGLPFGPADPARAGLQDDGLQFEIVSRDVTQGVDRTMAQFPADEFYWTIPVWSMPGGAIRGPVVYGGYGCAADRAQIPAPSTLGPLQDGESRIVLFQRGPNEDPDHSEAACSLGEKVQSGQLAGYDVVLVANDHAGSGGGTKPDDPYCAPPGLTFTPTVVGVCIGHQAFHRLFGRTPDYTRPYPTGDPGDVEPNVGDVTASTETIRVASLGQPVLASRSVLGQGWASFAVHSPGGTVRFPLRFDGDVSPDQVGAYLYSANDDFLGGVAFTTIRSEASYVIDVPAPGLHVEDFAVRDRPGMIAMTAEVTSDGPTDFKMLVWGAGRRAASWQFAVRGGDGVSILGSDFGRSSFLYMAREFSAPANAEAHALAGGRATVLGERVLDVTDTLVATFIELSTSLNNQLPWTGLQAEAMTVSTPAGDKVCVPASCDFNRFTGPDRAGPGTYTFKLSGAGVGISGSDDVLLYGADARLPSV